MNWHVHHRDILCFTHKTEGVCRSQQKLCPTISPSTSLVECDSEAQRSIQRCLNISSLKTTEQFFLYFKAFTCSLKTKQGIRSVYSTSSFLRWEELCLQSLCYTVLNTYITMSELKRQRSDTSQHLGRYFTITYRKVGGIWAQEQ